ncbi:MAG: hypothetical protein NVS2B11_12950 [Acetobacteraceae bacterium]
MPTNEIGTETAGITVAHSRRRNTAITATTSPMVSSRVNCTSATLARMVWVRSDTTSTLMLGGSEACSVGSALVIASTVDTTFALGWRCTLSNTARLSFSQAAWVGSSGPTTARPTSRTRIGAPLR